MTVQFLLYDLPSDHEVELNIVTECDVIRAIVSNRNQGKKVKTVRFASASSFRDDIVTPTKEVTYVHLAGHGNKQGLGFIDGVVGWSMVAKRIKAALTELEPKDRRVLCVSCCNSKVAVKKLVRYLAGYFTGMYYFSESKISFSTAMTVWSMFYNEKNLKHPHRRIVPRVNAFFPGKKGPLRFELV